MTCTRTARASGWRVGSRTVVCATVALCGLSGCGLGSGEKTGKVSLTVTRDFGTTQLGDRQSEVATASETAMRQIQRLRKVETKFSGGFVQSIDGLTGGSSGGRPRDWFFFVNGIESPVGAADVSLQAGDTVWWDIRDWGAATHVPAVVGSWPHPFTGLADGKKPTTRIDCAAGGESACAAVESALSSTGAISVRGLAGMAGKAAGLRVLVGDWKTIRTDPTAASLEEGAGASGVYLQPLSNGQGVRVLTPSGRVASTLRAGTGIVAATVVGNGPPTWIISGTDSAGLRAAARSLNAKSLENRFAIAVDSDGSVIAAPAVAVK